MGELSSERSKVQSTLGAAISELRHAASLTQEELSARTATHTTYISDIERGARNPSFAAVVRLATGLGVSVAEVGAEYERQRALGERRA